MIRCASSRLVAFLQCFGDFFPDGSPPRSVGVLPRQPIVFSWRADDSLRVLVHLRIIVLFLGILVLCLVETATNLNRVQLVSADTSIQYFLTTYFGIKGPLAFALHNWNGKRKIIVTHQENGTVRILLIQFNRVLFLCLFGKSSRAVLILHRVFGSDDILAIRSQNFLRGGDIEIRRHFNKSVSRLFGCIELLLLWLRRCSS